MNARRLGSYLLLAALLSYGGRARADASSEAQLQFELGSELYKQGRYVEAIDHFVASNRLAPNPNVVWNVAQTFAFLKRPIDAYNWYGNYLAFELPPERRAEGEAAREKLSASLSIIDIISAPSGAELFVDRIELGAIGHAPRKIAVEPGDHRVIARLDGYHDAEKSFTLAAGGREYAELSLKRITGELIVRSSPPGAQIRLEGHSEALGATPADLLLPVAELRLVVTLPGYLDQQRTVTLQDGQQSVLELKLVREPSTVAVLGVQGKPLASEVWLDHTRVGSAPLSLGDVQPGPHALELRAPEHEPWSATLLCEPGAATHVEFQLVDPRDRTWPGYRWLGYGLGGGLVLSGAVVGALALSAHSEFYRQPSRSELDRTRHLNTAADVLYVSGAVLLAGTLIYDLLRAPAPRSHGSVRNER